MTDHPETAKILSGTDIPSELREGLRVALENSIESAYLNRADLPIGAVALSGRRIVGRGYARDQQLNNPLLHAETVATLDANGEPFDTIVTTLEPCVQCQDFLVGQTGLRRVAFGSPRLDASNKGLIRHHDQTAAERAAELGFPFEVIELNDSGMRAINSSILDSVKRHPETGKVEVNDVQLLFASMALNRLGSSL